MDTYEFYSSDRENSTALPPDGGADDALTRFSSSDERVTWTYDVPVTDESRFTIYSL